MTMGHSMPYATTRGFEKGQTDMKRHWSDDYFERFFYWTLALVLLVGLTAGVLTPRGSAWAQGVEPQTYTVLAGSSDLYNTAALAFGPQTLQVHRGDSVTWVLGGFHNIHFEQALSDLVIAPEVDGQPLPQFNPAILFPTIDNGAAYQGGDANSGISLDPTTPMLTFSLVMDVTPGSYGFFCDIHPGMVGLITVVDDSTPIPSPNEVLQKATAELAATNGAGVQAAIEASAQPPSLGDDGTLMISAGLQAGSAAVLNFFPSVAVIDAGQGVTWTIPENSMEPHTITWPPLPPGSEFTPIPQEGTRPILAVSENALPSESGMDVSSGESFNSGILFAGQSYTLKFTEPGVYNYLCFLHPGMQGAIVVMPTS